MSRSRVPTPRSPRPAYCCRGRAGRWCPGPRPHCPAPSSGGRAHCSRTRPRPPPRPHLRPVTSSSDLGLLGHRLALPVGPGTIRLM